MEKIGIYGGSFDPPHNGHKALALHLKELTGVEKVIIIPAASSPFKNGTDASGDERLEMCRRAFTESFFEISDIELKRPGKSYTVDTLKELKAIYPDSVFYLFMGDDMFLSLDKWREYKTILSMCIPVASCRTENRDKLNSMIDFAKSTLLLHENEYIIYNGVPFEISSTEIRDLIRSGKNCKAYVPEKVINYIRTEGIYEQR